MQIFYRDCRENSGGEMTVAKLFLLLLWIVFAFCSKPAAADSPALAQSNQQPPEADSSKPQSLGTGKDDLLIVPGKSVGRVRLGMTREQVVALLGAPQEESKSENGITNALTYRSKPAKHTINIDFDNGRVSQIDFTSQAYKTSEGIGVGDFESAKNTKFFDRYIIRAPLGTRYLWKSGGLAFYHLNIDSVNPEHESVALGVVYTGHRPGIEPQSEGGPDNGWKPWNGKF
jgi:hypothetical protein